MSNPGPAITTTSLLHTPVENNSEGVQICTTAVEPLGFFGATPVVQPTSANQAVATDAGSVIVLANALRLALVNLGLIKGS